MSEKETVTIEIYWDDLTEAKQKEIREISLLTGIPQKTINCRKKVILEKLKKFF